MAKPINEMENTVMSRHVSDSDTRMRLPPLLLAGLRLGAMAMVKVRSTIEDTKSIKQSVTAACVKMSCRRAVKLCRVSYLVKRAAAQADAPPTILCCDILS